MNNIQIINTLKSIKQNKNSIIIIEYELNKYSFYNFNIRDNKLILKNNIFSFIFQIHSEIALKIINVNNTITI